MSQVDRAEKKAKASHNSSQGWSRNRMNKTHIKGRRKAKELTNGARRRVGVALIKASLDIVPDSRKIRPISIQTIADRQGWSSTSLLVLILNWAKETENVGAIMAHLQRVADEENDAASG